MIHLVDEENQQGQHDDKQEAQTAGQEAHHLAEARQMAYIFAHDVPVGNHVDIGKLVVVALGHIVPGAAQILDFRNPVGIQGELIVDDGVEGNNISLFQRLRVALADDNQISRPEGGGHGVGCHRQGGIARQGSHLIGIPGGQGGESEQSRQQDHRPQHHADKNFRSSFHCVHSYYLPFPPSFSCRFYVFRCVDRLKGCRFHRCR